jgi:dihydroflavonol-4-reductase
MSEDTVLVTGGSGFIAIHCIVALLNAGYKVRTTVRTLHRSGEVLTMLTRAGIEDPAGKIAFFAADLTADAGWPEAVAGCRYVLHVASPFHLRKVTHEDELVIPAREGTLRALRAARDAGVERVVVTSSFAAIGYGHPADRTEPFTEEDWTNIEGDDVSAYIKSKTVAERAAWDFLANEGGALQLATVNPTGVFGPALGPKLSGSVEILQKMMNGEIPACPRIAFGIVDVRDVADLHLLAMTRPEANGQRFLAVSGPALPFIEVSHMLQKHLGPAGKRLPKHELPDALIKALVIFRSDLSETVPQLGKKRDATSAKAENRLGWRPRSIEEAVCSSADSLLALGLVKP